MEKIKKYFMIGLCTLLLSSCNNWLDVQPENEQTKEGYWNSKGEVESVLTSGYYYLREAVPSLIQWGELRAGSIYQSSANHLQSFQMLATDKDLCNWGPLYRVINMANAVLKNTDAVLEKDQTFNQAEATSFKTEAYFLRALSYFYLLRNWRDVPVILVPYEDDKLSYSIAKSSEAEVLQQIKEDIATALNSGTAKESFEKDWQTKGRATVWALQALKADVCLWEGNYSEAVQACNEILNATSASRPVFMLGNSVETRWNYMFNPGNSNESIFELQFDYSKNKDNKWNSNLYGTDNPKYYYSSSMLEDFIEETSQAGGINGSVRAIYGGCNVLNTEFYLEAKTGYVWKYVSSEDGRSVRDANDYANFIIYRVAEVKLMKAEALVMMGSEYYDAAIDEINAIRRRANLPELDESLTVNPTEESLLTLILQERNMELAGEGKRWYDLLRFGRCAEGKYRTQFINIVADYNSTASPSWIRSVLKNDDALFLPIWESELKNNTELVQNPYYK